MNERTLKGGMCEINGWKVYDRGNEAIIEKRYEPTEDEIVRFNIYISLKKLLSYLNFVNIQEQVDYNGGIMHASVINQVIPINLGNEIRASDWKIREDEGEIRLYKEYYDINDDILLIKLSARFDKELDSKYKLEVEEGIYYIKNTSSNTLRHNKIEDEIVLSNA